MDPQITPEIQTDSRAQADRIMTDLQKSGAPFDGDAFYDRCAAAGLPLQLIRRLSGATFRRFKAAGLIKKTGQFRLSKRNSSAMVSEWVGALDNLKA
jgi:hypothetical protein